MENTRKKKIVVLSDHALSTSGVGTQTRHLIHGLLEKGTWSFRQLGAAMKHASYDVITVNDDFIIKPVDGFGTKEQIRLILATEKPDGILIFTDPRFFVWFFEIEDEVRQVCPIFYWHVWDNAPYPAFNNPYYDSCDLINCHSYHTFEQVSEKYPEKTNFVPHALPNDIFYEIPEEEKNAMKKQFFGDSGEDLFIGFWMNRNAKRKRPGDLLLAWSMFIKTLEKNHGHKKAKLIMHTDPRDNEGPNLIAIVDMLGIRDNVLFSNQRVGFKEINILHNIADFTINISFAEGFGLSTLEAMQTGTPIIAPKTGGQTRQVVDHRDGSENGFALPIEFKTLVGSQNVPYIYEDYTSIETIAEKITAMYELGKEGRKALGEKAKKYVESEFNYQKTIDLWHDTMNETIEKFQKNTRRFTWSSL